VSAGNVFVSGTASNVILSSGGYGLAVSGGTVRGVTLSGGELELMSGATTGSSTIGFAGAGGYLKLDDSAHFSSATVISGFGVPGNIDLVDVAFSAATVGYSGTTLSGALTVGDGTHVATLAMLGNYVAGSFHMADDGNGGTLITDPPVSGGSGLASPH
jgi:hypothetical protein